MLIWSAEIKELGKLQESFKGQFPEVEKELEQLLKTEDANVILLYSRRCLEIIITDLCECELNRPRKTEPLKGIIDKLRKEGKVPSHIIASMNGLNDLSTFGTHPKEFDPRQVKPVLNNLSTILEWYLKYKNIRVEEVIKEPISLDEKISAERPIKKKPREIPSVSFLHRLKDFTDFSKRTWRVIALICIVLSIGTVWFGLKNTTSISFRAEIRYDIEVDNYIGYIFLRTKSIALSADGEYLVYSLNINLDLKKLNSDAPSEPIIGTTNSMNPFISPDGNWVGFYNFREEKIMKVPISGGNPIKICDLEGSLLRGGINNANWYESEIIFAIGNTIYRVPDSGGIPEVLYPLNASGNDPVVWNPQLLPDRKTLLFSQQLEDGGWCIMTWQLGSRENPVVLVERGRDVRYLYSGHIAYTLNHRIYLCEFDSKRNQIVTEPQIISTNPVYENPASHYGVSQFDFSENGIMVYYEHEESRMPNLVWVNVLEEVTPINEELKTDWYDCHTISSDEQYIAVSFIPIGKFGHQIDLVNIRTGNSQIFAEEAYSPVWSADNSCIYYVSDISGNKVFQKPIDQITPARLLFELDSAMYLSLQNLSSNGRYLTFEATFDGQYDIGYYDLINDKVEILNHYNTSESENNPAISPNGEWLAYVSNQDGQTAIYVAPFPGPGQSERVTSGRATSDIYSPSWSRDNKALYYNTTESGFELWKININTAENDFSFEKPHPVFYGGRRFDVGRDIEMLGSTNLFLMMQTASATEEIHEPRIKVIVNWENELESN